LFFNYLQFVDYSSYLEELEFCICSSLNLLSINISRIVHSLSQNEIKNCLNDTRIQRLQNLMKIDSTLCTTSSSWSKQLGRLFEICFQFIFSKPANQIELIHDLYEKCNGNSIESATMNDKIRFELVLGKLTSIEIISKIVVDSAQNEYNTFIAILKQIFINEIQNSKRVNIMDYTLTAISNTFKLKMAKFTSKYLPISVEGEEKVSNEHIVIELEDIKEYFKGIIDVIELAIRIIAPSTIYDLPAIVQESFLNGYLPFVLNTFHEIIKCRNQILFQKGFSNYEDLLHSLLELHKVLQSKMNFVSLSERSYEDQSCETLSRHETYESRHPYESNMDVYVPIKFPGASLITIVFDPACRSEHDCDYIEFLTCDHSRTILEHTERYSGRDGSEVYIFYCHLD